MATDAIQTSTTINTEHTAGHGANCAAGNSMSTDREQHDY
jgi:hypothetical protein